MSKEFMAQLKTLLDEYIKENQPFKVYKTYRMNEVQASYFNDKILYDYYKSLFPSGEYVYVIFQIADNYAYLGDVTTYIKDGGGFYRASDSLTQMIKADWSEMYIPVNRCTVKNDSDGNKYVNTEKVTLTYAYNYGIDFRMGIATPDGGNIRVYNTKSDFINYSVGQRKVYYTSNYYNYVPEDLSVSIDELQKTIEDMQDVIDKLLEQITDDTSESEIEELLRLILEELKNQQGGGGGSGGGGDVNVDIDLSTTNGLLSKILAKVTQIFDKISETAGGAVDAVNTKLQETLDEILSTLKSIRRWNIADTVFDGVDALADVASFLKDFLTAPAAAIDTAASSLGETANMLTDKFPFSIPWDMAALVTLLSAEPQAPVFKLPITVESAGIEEYMEIDMSQFEYLSTIMRGMLSILYAYGILSMTTKVMDIGGKK